jgi:hypothetical protein
MYATTKAIMTGNNKAIEKYSMVDLVSIAEDIVKHKIKIYMAQEKLS